MDTFDITALQAWVGRQETRCDVISVAPVTAMSATLDYKVPRAGVGDPLPIPWHWLYFLPASTASDLDVDGHPRRGGFLPPVPLPRRMWAGGKIEFIRPLQVGDFARKESTVRDVTVKQGRTGKLCFVEVEHCIFVDQDLRFRETHNIVYRDLKQAGEEDALPPTAPQDPQWTREVIPDSTLLFRYSALTFNGHRIHYDLDFCRRQEGYPGLVFHGPLTATLLLELAMQNNPGRSLKYYEFKALSPLFDDAAFSLNGKMHGTKADLWATNADNRLAMKASVVF